MPAQLTLHDLRNLLRSTYGLLRVTADDDGAFRDALVTCARDLDRSLMTWTPSSGLLSVTSGRTVLTTVDPATLLRQLRSLQEPAIVLLGDFGRHLEDPVVKRSLGDLVAAFAATRSFVVVTHDPRQGLLVPDDVGVPLSWQTAPKGQIAAAIEACLGMFRAAGRLGAPVDAATKAAVVSSLEGATPNQARQAVAAIIWESGRLSLDSLPGLGAWRAQLATGRGAVEWFPAEDNRFELGGFGRFKGWVTGARAALGSEASRPGRPRPRAVLLAGAEGCGKSLAVRVLARACRAPLVRVAARRIPCLDAAVHRILAEALETAARLAPSVLWIDGLELIADDEAGKSGQSGIAEWIGSPRAPVLVAATTRDLWKVPREVLAGRLFRDRFFVDLPDAADRDAILRLHLMRRGERIEGFDLAHLVEASEGCGGRDLEVAVVAAIQRADGGRRALDTATLADELRCVTPLSVARRHDLDRLREMARGRFVPVR